MTSKVLLKPMSQISRRDALKLLACLGIAAMARQGFGITLPQAIVYLSPFSPPPKENTFDGDNQDIPHEFLWDKEGTLKRYGQPETTVNIETLIIGGGIAGLVCLDTLQNTDCILLEQAPQLGGNSKGHKNFDGSVRSSGAAYITIPDNNSPIDLYLKKINLTEQGRIESDSPVINGHDYFKKFEETLTENELIIFQNIQTVLRDIFENSYPEIPLSTDSENRKFTLNLDQISFKEWLSTHFPEVPTPIFNYYQIYAWSSFNASLSEISAAQFLNFICSELDGIWVFPGGNALIIEKILNQIKDNNKIKTESFVVNIKKVTEGFETLYIKNKILHKIISKKVIFAAPKFLVDKIFDHDQFLDLIKATENLEYRPYIVAQVDLNHAVSLPSFDHFILEKELMLDPSPLKPLKLGFTDIANADWAANKDSHFNSRLTIYKPYPYQGAQQFLFNPMAYDKIKKQVKTELEKHGITEKQISSISLTRWGHSMPIAHKGFLFRNQLALLNDCRHEGLYFAGQDLYANPSFECAFETAQVVLEKL